MLILKAFCEGLVVLVVLVVVFVVLGVVLVVLGVVLEQVEAVAKPLLLPVLKNTTPRTTQTTTEFSSCGKSYPNYFWGVPLMKRRDYSIRKRERS